VKLAIVQSKPRKGDLAGNLDALTEIFTQLAGEDAPELIVLPEAALTGYFLEGAVYDLSRSADAMAAEIGARWREACGSAPRPVDVVLGFYENSAGTYYNAAMYLAIEAHGERIVHVHRKLFLPTYGVFDEERFLSRGRRLGAFDTRFGRMAILICEDAWHAIVPTLAAIKGARFIVIPSASPGRGLDGADGRLESVAHWEQLLRAVAVEHGVYVIYAGLAGFEGGKGMAGASCVVGPRGDVLVSGPPFGACILRAELDLGEIDLARANLPLLGDLAAVLPDLLLDADLLPHLAHWRREVLDGAAGARAVAELEGAARDHAS
jgi:predicted amidohydrolase